MPLKYQFNISIGAVTHNAGNKAVEDCKQMLSQRGYKNIEIAFNKKALLLPYNLFKLLLGLASRFFLIKKGSLIMVQYPLLGINNYFYRFIRLLQNKKCFVACIIHDLESLRFKKNDTDIAAEIFNLNSYDLIISHNAEMTSWLVDKGLKVKTIDLGIFDYLEENTDHIEKFSTAGKKSIVFAGSLNRGKFLGKLKDLAGQIKFKLYGTLNGSLNILSPNVVFAGSFPPDKLIEKLDGGFGLIWDGDEINDCEGQFGDYLQYNNPHKLSLYIAAQLPVILPVKAALANFVSYNNIGFAIQSLTEINLKICELDNEEYKKMTTNLSQLSLKVKKGFFFNKALDEVESVYLQQLNGNVNGI